MPRCAGRPYAVTDDGPPIAFADAYAAAGELSSTPAPISRATPVALFLLAHATEAWCLLLARFPFLTTRLGLREPAGPIHFLQPAVFSVSVHTLIDDRLARRSVADGGFGYRPACTTLEGVCQQLVEWNREQERERERERAGGAGVNGAAGTGPAATDGKVAKAGLVAKGVAA